MPCSKPVLPSPTPPYLIEYSWSLVGLIIFIMSCSKHVLPPLPPPYLIEYSWSLVGLIIFIMSCFKPVLLNPRLGSKISKNKIRMFLFFTKIVDFLFTRYFFCTYKFPELSTKIEKNVVVNLKQLYVNLENLAKENCIRAEAP